VFIASSFAGFEQVPCPPPQTADALHHARRTTAGRRGRKRMAGIPISEGFFRDRRAAGQALAQRLPAYSGRGDVVVLGLPRGGVPVAYEVAHALGVPMDVFVVRKLGVPGRDEFAMGAIASGGVRVLNQQVMSVLNIPAEVLAEVTAREQLELERRERIYRGDRPAPQVRDRTVILVDDGLATGATMQAAVKALRRQEPARIVVAVPTGAPETCEQLRAVADDVVCATAPQPFISVSLWYDDFAQTSDEEVAQLLEQAHRMPDRA
jgi:putative phosphoribosyl transferase